MFEQEKHGYKKSEVDYYIKRLDDDFRLILKNHTERLENVKRNVTDISIKLGEYTKAIPMYKNEIESLRERLMNIRGWTETASKSRYLTKSDLEAVLANLITQVLSETDKLEQLKPINPPKRDRMSGEDFFEILASDKDIKLEDSLAGFDFFDNNPYKEKAEKQLAKIERKRQKVRS